VIATIVALLVFDAQPTPVQYQALTIWCSRLLSAADVGDVRAQVAYGKSEDDLCHGRYGAAQVGFAAIVPVWIKRQSDGRWWLDTARGYFYSLIAAGDYAKARTFLTSLETANNWKAHKGDRLFWHGDARSAFAAYAAEAGTLDGMPGGDRSTIIDDAVKASDMDAAIAILQKPSGATGPSDVGSLQLLMLGDAYETQRRWHDAFATWVRAADSGHAVAEFDTFDSWNLSALEMIYYYRAHQPH
jgi:hypothetical protein